MMLFQQVEKGMEVRLAGEKHKYGVIVAISSNMEVVWVDHNGHSLMFYPWEIEPFACE